VASKRAVSKIEGRVYTHRIVWRVAVDAGKRAARSRKDWNARVTASLFCAFTFEAFLNVLIEHVDQDVWRREREFFGKGRYAGTRGKLRWIEKALTARSTGDMARNRQRVLKTFELRDMLAHAKPIVYEDEFEHPIEEDRPFMQDRWIEHYTDPNKVKGYLTATEAMIEWLHSKAKHVFTDPHLSQSALRGVLQAETGSTSAGE
jgi:hypothetical protein